MKKLITIIASIAIASSFAVSAETEFNSNDAMAKHNEKAYTENVQNAVTCIKPGTTQQMSFPFDSRSEMLSFIESVSNTSAFAGYKCETNKLIIYK